MKEEFFLEKHSTTFETNSTAERNKLKFFRLSTSSQKGKSLYQKIKWNEI